MYNYTEEYANYINGTNYTNYLRKKFKQGHHPFKVIVETGLMTLYCDKNGKHIRVVKYNYWMANRRYMRL